jgi:hypothetical protein
MDRLPYFTQRGGFVRIQSHRRDRAASPLFIDAAPVEFVKGNPA